MTRAHDSCRVILAAHGSRRPAANDELRRLAGRLAVRLAACVDGVECAFMEFETPSIDTAIDTAVARGARELLVLPYFLAADRHVHADIPEIVTRKAEQYPQVRIRLAEYVGARPVMLDLLEATVRLDR